MYKRKRRLTNKIAIFLQGYFTFGIKPCCAWYYANASIPEIISISKLKHKYNIQLDFIPCPSCLIKEYYAKFPISHSHSKQELIYTNFCLDRQDVPKSPFQTYFRHHRVRDEARGTSSSQNLGPATYVRQGRRRRRPPSQLLLSLNNNMIRNEYGKN